MIKLSHRYAYENLGKKKIMTALPKLTAGNLKSRPWLWGSLSLNIVGGLFNNSFSARR